MTFKVTSILAAAAAAVLAGSGAAFADQAQHTYATSLVETGPLASAGAVTGKLTLTTSSDGIVQGWYIPDSDPRYVPVSGGATNGKLWLNIGERGDLQVTAEIQPDGSISGAAVDLTPAPAVVYTRSPASFTFVATPK